MENISGFENVTISNGGVSSNQPVTTTVICLEFWENVM